MTTNHRLPQHSRIYHRIIFSNFRSFFLNVIIIFLLYRFQSLFSLPLALSERPAGDYPQGNHKHEEHRARAYGHERLQHEPRIEVDTIQGTDAAGRRIREQLAVQQHHPADEIQPEEHGQR